MTQDVFFGVCYVPPEGTKYASNDCFLEIKQELIHLAHDQNKLVCFMDDFNARTVLCQIFSHLMYFYRR